jgi:N-acyl-D-aspartate/D-glutamate deacylase
MILAVGNLEPLEGENIVDGNGMILSPGFIDSHSHVGGSLEAHPDGLAAISQGITTIVEGQDGGSYLMDSLRAMMARTPAAVNVANYTGHATLREMTMGEKDLWRRSTPVELDKMKSLLKQELDKGSLGLSSGLEYEEGFYSSFDEVVSLAKVAASENTRYISHIRSEDMHLDEALDEIIEIGREAKLPVQISHFKIALRDRWGQADEILAKLQQARAEGIDITADCYPYVAWHSTLRVLFPKKDFNNLESAQYACDHLIDPAGSVVARFKPEPTYAGKTISQIAEMRKESPARTLVNLVKMAAEFRDLHPDEGGVESVMGKSMSDEDTKSLLSWPYTNICSDGANGGHPRGYGSFPRILAKYVREEKAFSLEEAVRKMTSLSAEHTGIRNRGIIAPGMLADLVLFDPSTVKDNSTVENSKALATGILKVWVNGTQVYENGKFLGVFPGQLITR